MGSSNPTPPQTLDYAVPPRREKKPLKPISRKMTRLLFAGFFIALPCWLICTFVPFSGSRFPVPGQRFYILHPWVTHVALNLGLFAFLLCLVECLIFLIYRRWGKAFLLLVCAFVGGVSYLNSSVSSFYFRPIPADVYQSADGKTYYSYWVTTKPYQYALGVEKQSDFFADSYLTLAVAEDSFGRAMPTTRHAAPSRNGRIIQEPDDTIHVLFDEACRIQYNPKTGAFTDIQE
jgi:hypothetical protein